MNQTYEYLLKLTDEQQAILVTDSVLFADTSGTEEVNDCGAMNQLLYCSSQETVTSKDVTVVHRSIT
jgi:hypothetical protein